MPKKHKPHSDQDKFIGKLFEHKTSPGIYVYLGQTTDPVFVDSPYSFMFLCPMNKQKLFSLNGFIYLFKQVQR